jgi:multiple sugar transport system substrate-binding protein
MTASLVAVAGCSPIASSTDDSTITFLTLDGGDDNLALEDIADAYEAEHPGTTIEITYVPEDTYTTKLQTAMLADSPDIATVYGADSAYSFLSLNDALFAANGIDPDDYNATLRSSCEIDGKIYCMGTTVGNMALFYNKDMFDAAGVAYPSDSEAMSFEDFAGLAAQLTIPGDDDHKIFGGGTDIVQAYMDPAYYLDSTGRTVEVLNDGYLGAVSTLAGVIAAGNGPTSGQTLSVGGSEDGFGLQTMFTDGRLAMFVGDNYAVDSLEAAGLNFGLAPTPIVAGGSAWVPAWTNAYGVPTGAKHQDEAIDFLAFVATEGQSIQAQYGQMPLLTSVAEDWANSDARNQLVAVSKLARIGTFNPNQWAWNSPLIDAYKAAMRGEPIRPLFEDAQPKAQQANDTTWETFDQAAAAAGD